MDEVHGRLLRELDSYIGFFKRRCVALLVFPPLRPPCTAFILEHTMTDTTLPR